MAHVLVKGEIEVPAERLWGLVADFADVGWMPGGERARTEGDGPGMVRILGMGATEIRERLESRDPATQTIVYTIPQGLPMPIRDYRATMTVRATGDRRSELLWACTFEPDGATEAEATAQVDNLYQMMIGWIRDYLTT